MATTSDTAYAMLFVRGDDAFSFLQGQLTGDLMLLDQAVSIPAAWCNPKGRVICLFRTAKIDGGYAFPLPAEIADAVVQRLTMFRFRARVDFETRPATPQDLGATGTIDEWRLANLRCGVADVRAGQSEQFTPHMLNLDLLGAISLDKGCYTGQEIVARTHYRGATKRRMFRFESETPVGEGTGVCLGDKKVGEVVNAIGNDLLAVVPVDTRDDELVAGSSPLNRIPLPYETK